MLDPNCDCELIRSRWEIILGDPVTDIYATPERYNDILLDRVDGDNTGDTGLKTSTSIVRIMNLSSDLMIEVLYEENGAITDLKVATVLALLAVASGHALSEHLRIAPALFSSLQ
jgi:hypothetical protein